MGQVSASGLCVVRGTPREQVRQVHVWPNGGLYSVDRQTDITENITIFRYVACGKIRLAVLVIRHRITAAEQTAALPLQ